MFALWLLNVLKGTTKVMGTQIVQLYLNIMANEMSIMAMVEIDVIHSFVLDDETTILCFTLDKL